MVKYDQWSYMTMVADKPKAKKEMHPGAQGMGGMM
jgi:hypothetical protein